MTASVWLTVALKLVLDTHLALLDMLHFGKKVKLTRKIAFPGENAVGMLIAEKNLKNTAENAEISHKMPETEI